MMHIAITADDSPTTPFARSFMKPIETNAHINNSAIPKELSAINLNIFCSLFDNVKTPYLNKEFTAFWGGVKGALVHRA